MPPQKPELRPDAWVPRLLSAGCAISRLWALGSAIESNPGGGGVMLTLSYQARKSTCVCLARALGRRRLAVPGKHEAGKPGKWRRGT